MVCPTVAGRRVAVCAALIAVTACGPKPVAVVPVGGPTPEQRLAAAGDMVRAGCVECFESALAEYESLLAVPSVTDAAETGIINTAALLALRERELGMIDRNYLAHAREVAERRPIHTSFLEFQDIIDAVPAGGASNVNDEPQLQKRMRAIRNRQTWVDTLRPRVNDDDLTRYTWLAFNCAYDNTAGSSAETFTQALDESARTPLLLFRAANCRGIQRPVLTALLEQNPRFIEIEYLLGVVELRDGKPEEANNHFLRAYEWHPQWPAVTMSLADIAFGTEDFQSAVDFYDATLGLLSDHSEALIGRIRSLSYLGRYAEALEAVDRLLQQKQWFIGDAYYWRAWNETQLARYDEAWVNVERASTLLVNAEVSKLSGVIAFRRQQLEVARQKFEESRKRDSTDCETAFYLGSVHAEQRTWPEMATLFAATAACLDDADAKLKMDIDSIRTGSSSEEYRTRLIRRREQQLVANGRTRATSLFNVSVAYYNMSDRTEARRYAEMVQNDEQFGQRARDLLAALDLRR